MNAIIGNIVTLIPLILIIYLVYFDKTSHKRKSSKHFLFAMIITAIELILDMIITLNSDCGTSSAQLCTIAKSISFTLAPFATYNLFVISIIDTPLEKYQNLFKVPVIINAGLSISSIWTGLIFSVSATNEYFRGPLFLLQCLLHMVYLALFFIYDFSKARKYMLDDKVCFIVNFMVMIIAFCLQLIYKHMCIVWPTVSTCLIFYYITHLNHNLRRDTLTTLFNRHMYERDLERFNHTRNVTIINIDVNDFKDINDNSGHHYGDEVLQKAAFLLQKYFDPYGYTYRVGGDEFCVIITKAMPVTLAAAFVTLEEELIPEKQRMGITKLLSYGYYKYSPNDTTDIYHAVKQADYYMYKYKNRYKSNLVNLVNL